jgi:integrase
VVHWCPATPGFGVKVSLTGDRSFVFERRVDGKTVRRTLGKAPGAKGAGAISTEAARSLCITVSSELQTGVDRTQVKRELRKTEQEEALSLDDAIAAYVKGKRRGKDGLPLKARTKADYLAMVAPGRIRNNGEPYADGPLFPLASKSIHRITADDMREVYKDTEKKSQRTATYAMQVLRAVLNWHGVAIDESPLSKATAGRDRIVLPPTAGDPHPVPPEKLGAWWRAATKRAGNVGADGCRFILLTGCRPGEVFGSKGDGWEEPGLLVENVDLKGMRLTLVDTKNRKDHQVALSSQALEIVKAHCKNKAPDAKVFDILDPGKTVDSINADAEVTGITPHKLRHTFASVAEELVSGYALKRMINHSNGGDVTGTHYVGKSETQLRNAWQTVADFIEGAK